jgi:putative phosphoesterase
LESTAIVIELEFLGTGTSTGIPVIGCDCAVCRSDDPRDRRLRSSVLVRIDGTTILIDTSPDLREQMLGSNTRRIDAVLFTHTHADHTAGLDELRRYNIMQAQRLPVWAPANAAADLNARFDYAFREDFPFFGAKPDLDLHIIGRDQPFDAVGVAVQPIPIMHGTLPIVGYRIGDLAYVTDIKEIPESSFDYLRDLDVLVLTALRKKPHVAHMSLDEALEMVERIQPRQTFLTHVAHEMGLHAVASADLPENVAFATDGLVVRTGVREHAAGEEVERIAVVSDVHGNMTAYEAVLADIATRGIRRVINLGDVIGKGPRGSAAIARTRERCEATVRGNWDEFVDREDLDVFPPMRWWHDELTDEDRAWLRGLPFSIDVELGGRRIRMFHASADSVGHRVRARHSDDDFAGMFRNTPATGAGGPPDVVVYGDIHYAYAEERGGRLLINAGSVGNALDEPTAAYAVLEGMTGGDGAGTFRHEIVRVPYEIEAEIAVARESGMLEADAYAGELRTAIYRNLRAAPADD